MRLAVEFSGGSHSFMMGGPATRCASELVGASRFASMWTDLDGMSTFDDAARMLVDIERASRELEAFKARAIAEVRRRGLYQCDGHIRLTGWLRSVVNIPSVEAHRLDRLAKLVDSYPTVGRLMTDGTLGIAQANRLASAHANRRVAWSFPAFADLLIENAVTLPFDDFAQVVDHWQRLADADGTHRHAELVHENRDATVNVVGDATYVDGHLGNLQGTLVAEVFNRYLQRELDRDIAERDALGLTLDADLPRTPSQRRADALVAVFTAAAAGESKVLCTSEGQGCSSPAPCSHTASSHPPGRKASSATRDVFDHGPASRPDRAAGCAGSSSRRR